MTKIIVTREGHVTAEMLADSSLIVVVDREFDEPIDDPCDGCLLVGIADCKFCQEE